MIIVDCVTLWLTDSCGEQDKAKVSQVSAGCVDGEDSNEISWSETKAALLKLLPTLAGEIYLVSNEVGCGIVPLGELNRRFVDEAGWLHQDIARLADSVVLVTAGLPMTLKGV